MVMRIIIVSARFFECPERKVFRLSLYLVLNYSSRVFGVLKATLMQVLFYVTKVGLRQVLLTPWHSLNASLEPRPGRTLDLGGSC